MRRMVIGDARRRDASGFEAEPTQWLDHELMSSAALPASSAVPTMNFPTVRHRGQGLPRFLTFSKPREYGMLKPNAFGLPTHREFSRPCLSQPRANGHARHTRVRVDASRNF
jgi:hypothetical protein